MAKKSNNHAKAPEAAKFVNAMREVFGEVTVLHVEEGGLKLGDPTDGWVPVTVEA